jgi:hypothetical protein
MPALHPALRIGEDLLRREKQKLRLSDRDALFAYQPVTTAAAERLADELTGAGKSSGEENLDSFNGALEFISKGMQFGFIQKQLFTCARLVMLQRMFGDTLGSSIRKLRERYGFRRLYEQAAVTLPRRSGKTVAQTVLAAIVAVSQRNGNVCCFQIGGRQAKEWLAQVIVYLRMFRGSPWDWTLEKIDSKEYIQIKNRYGTVVQISSYPGPRDADATNFRGMGKDLALLLYDEYYFFREVVWSTTLPLAKLGAPILMTSSMSKNFDDAVRRMVYAKMDDGQDLFLKLDWMRACPDCVSRGAANECTHIEHRPQHFEPRGSLKRMKALIKPFGNEGFERELMNAAAATNRLPVFRPEWLLPLRSREHDFSPVGPRVYNEFFVGFDPAGKGFSRTAIVCIAFDTVNPPPGVSYRAVILSAEVIPRTITDDIGRDIVLHIQKVRLTIDGVRSARAIICIENNSILVADSVRVAIERMAGVHNNMGIMCENARTAGRGTASEIDVRSGTRTTNRSKEEIVNKLRALLVEGALQFHKKFFIPHPELQPPGEVTDEAGRALFVDELASFCGEICKSKGPIASQRKPHVKYRGYRIDGEKAHDDKLMAAGFCLQCYPLYKLAPQLCVQVVGPR